MAMSKSALRIATFVWVAVALSNAQSTAPSTLNPSRPSIFLEASARNGDSFVKVSLHNNLTQQILLYPSVSLSEVRKLSSSQYAFNQGQHVELCYDVEPVPEMVSRRSKRGIETDIPKKATIVHDQEDARTSCWWGIKFPRTSGVWLLPGESVSFSVPIKKFVAGSRLYTYFNYEWEVEGNSARPSEPVHLAHFYGSDLNIKP